MVLPRIKVMVMHLSWVKREVKDHCEHCEFLEVTDYVFSYDLDITCPSIYLCACQTVTVNKCVLNNVCWKTMITSIR